jgi:hypothetical protein
MRREYVVAVLLIVALVPAAGATGGNEAPLADAGLDQEVEQGRTVVLDATGSVDPDGSIAAYDWTITAPNGSTISPRCSSCARTRFDADQVGRYEVTVDVADGDGATRRDILYVDVGTGPGSQPEDGGGSGPPADVGAGGPPASVDSGASSPGVGTADTVSASRVSCTSEEVRLGHDCVGIDQPHVRISGPDYVAVGEDAGFSTETFNFEGSKSYGWSTGGGGPSTSASWTTPGTKTVVVSVRDDRGNTDVTQTWVRVVENKPPRVQIGVPSDLSPGKEISLSTSVKEDPDGEIVDTDWSPSSTITVPENGTAIVTVTVTDDGGAVATDKLSIDSKANIESGTAGATVYCYYTKEWQKERGSPHHCENPDATPNDWHDGFSTAPSAFKRYQRSDQISVAWKKVPENHLSGGASPVGRPSDIVEQAYPTANLEELTGGPAKGVKTETDQLSSFTLNGKTVYADLTGDSDVNAADWDKRYGLSDESVGETHRNAVYDLRGTRQNKGLAGTKGSNNNESSKKPHTTSDDPERSNNANVDESAEMDEKAVDEFKNTQRSNSSSDSSSSSSSKSSSNKSSSSGSTSKSSSNSSSSRSSQSSGGHDGEIDYTGGLGETSKGGTGHASHSI